MSLLLDQAAKQDAQRREDLAREDEAEKARIEADMAYLVSQPERDARRIALLHEEELNRFRAAGVM